MATTFKTGNFYKIIKEDVRLVQMFPQLTLNTIFEAVIVDDEEDAVTRVCLANGDVIDALRDSAGKYKWLFDGAFLETEEV